MGDDDNAAVLKDAMIHGTGFSLDGNHIPYSSVKKDAATEIRELAEQFADVVERIAFDVTPPNSYTPRIVMACQEFRRRLAGLT